MAQIGLMELGEATAVEGAILWRAQTILETLQRGGELDSWLHGVGLAVAIGELQSEVERMETVVNGVQGRAVGNKPLARSLARAKELIYDADDVVDELDYRRLQHKVEEGTIAPTIELEGMGGDGAEQVNSPANTVVMLPPATVPEGMVGHGHRDGAEQLDTSAKRVRKNRSKVWEYFDKLPPAVNGEPGKAKCKECGTQLTLGHGTSVLKKHLDSADCKKKRSAIEETPTRLSDCVQNGGVLISTNDLEGRKRMRTECNVAAAPHTWDKAEVLTRIQVITLELRSIRGDVIKYLKDSVARSDQYESNSSDTRVRTSSSLHGKVYGRDEQKKEIMRAIKDAKSDKITVLPIVGTVGVGKTALAKLVYNDPRVQRKFERIWVWVSNIYDEVRVTREILDVVTLARHEGSHKRESYEGVRNYSKLLEVLKKHMACLSKKFLLILDDVGDFMDNSKWKDLIDALGSSCTKGNVIIVTARSLSVAQRLGTLEPVKLQALKDEDIWLLFKECAFGDNNSKEHLDIGRQIATELNGNPLAAKNASDMLREQPTVDQWKIIMKHGVWESLQIRGGIVTALKIIYYQLPYHLQQCFLVCSIFPKKHLFHIDGLVYMWRSLGFIKAIEIGRDYLNALINSGFLEQVDAYGKKGYVMCGIMHEFARLISRTEFATIDGLECKEVLPTVRHLSILTDLVYHIDETGIIPRNWQFEDKLKSLVSLVTRLRTLILIGKYDPLFFRSFHTFMCNSVNYYIHLRYLKLDNTGRDLHMLRINLFQLGNRGSQEALPISLSKFYHLEVLDTGCRAIEVLDTGCRVIVHGMSDLISMRHLVLTNGAFGVSCPAWSTCLQTIHLEDCQRCETIPSLERISSLTKLKLRNMQEVTEVLIPSLEELSLIDMPKLESCSCNSVRALNTNLRVLEIRKCRVLKTFPLFVFESCENSGIGQKSWLPNVIELTIHECPNLMVSNPLPPSSSFCKLSIIEVHALPTMKGSSNGELEISS